MFTRSIALGLLASTVSAFDASASNNVAMYWGQGSYQISLTELCNDPSVDIVNIAFVNQFPKRRGEYPSTNFGMYTRLPFHSHLSLDLNFEVYTISRLITL
jgi:chitinase